LQEFTPAEVETLTSAVEEVLEKEGRIMWNKVRDYFVKVPFEKHVNMISA
jgi:hypothetical protein